MKKIFVVIPSLNEEANISFVTKIIDQGLTQFFPKFSRYLINSDSNSRDNTVNKFKSTTTDSLKIALKCSKAKTGKGYSIETGFKHAYKQNGKIPYQIITDKLPSYQDGIRKTFRNWGNERKVKHTSILGRRRQINNNAIENHHTHQKEFQKVRRGINETQTYADGFKVFHNFVRKGVKDKLTPAERCGIEVQGNKWETMLIKSLEVPQLTGEKNIAKSP